jgi:hypothetical protein
MTIPITGRGKLLADMAAGTAGATLSIASASGQRPVFWARLCLNLAQLRQLTAGIDDAIQHAALAAGTRSAAQAGRLQWNDTDHAAAAREAERLYGLADPGHAGEEARSVHGLIDRIALDGRSAAEEIAALERAIAAALAP